MSTPIVYELDPAHSHLGFSIRHMMVSQQRGTIKAQSGTLTLDRGNLANSRVEVAIDVASINTNVNDRDNHLRHTRFVGLREGMKARSVGRKGKARFPRSARRSSSCARVWRRGTSSRLSPATTLL